MLGTVIKGAYKGSSLHRAENSKALYLQTPSGERIGINKNTAISAKNVADTGEYNGQKAMCITWLNGETSIVLLGAKLQTNNVPAFTPPAPAVPTFTPPTQTAPVFQPPKTEAPTFAPPANAVPTFTPPAAPKFSPPVRPAFNGPACHYHPDEPAVKRCAKCGKPICKDCYDNYKLTGGEYAGRALCYDCCQALVEANVQQLQENYATIKARYTGCLVGCVIGAIIGIIWGGSAGIAGALVYGLLCAAIGGSASNFFRRFISAIPGFFVSTGNLVLSICIGLFKFVVCFFWYAIRALFETVQKIMYYMNYMKRTEGFIESDTAALQHMKDYMEYTLIRSRNVGVDIDTLLAQESKLADNSFARMVQEQGEDQAEANFRGVTATINEHGEIIRSFAA